MTVDTGFFLAPDEVAFITEYTRPSRQRSQLARMGIPFIVSRTGKPLVSVRALEKTLGIDTAFRGDRCADLDVTALQEVMSDGKKTH